MDTAINFKSRMADVDPMVIANGVIDSIEAANPDVLASLQVLLAPVRITGECRRFGRVTLYSDPEREILCSAHAANLGDVQYTARDAKNILATHKCGFANVRVEAV